MKAFKVLGSLSSESLISKCLFNQSKFHILFL